jgi:hypothetical protein
LWLIIRRENDFFIIQRPNRALPLISYLLSSVLFVVFTSYVAQDKLDIPVVLLVFIVMAGVSAVVTFFWKISLHTLGWGAAFVFATVRWEFEGKPGLTVLSVCCLVVAGISRFHLRAHDIAQLAAGLILGVLTACLLVITL